MEHLILLVLIVMCAFAIGVFDPWHKARKIKQDCEKGSHNWWYSWDMSPFPSHCRDCRVLYEDYLKADGEAEWYIQTVKEQRKGAKP